MLTKADFAQIRKIIREEVETESGSIKEELGAEIKLSRMELQREIHVVAERAKNLEIRLRKIQKDIKTKVSHLESLPLPRTRENKTRDFFSLHLGSFSN